MRGFSLVENLVALGILAFAMLGCAGLFAVALEQLHFNRQQRVAILLGEELIDLLIVTRDRRAAGRSGQCDIGTQSCFGLPAAEPWISDWHKRLRDTLPNAAARMNMRATATATTYQLDIMWDGRAAQAQSQQFEILLRT